MYLGYNTNGLAHHRLDDALRLLAELGYRGAAITIDHGALAPNDPDLSRQLAYTKQLLHELNLHCVVETGARFLLDYRRKHFPTLLAASEADRRRRVAFLEHALDVAAELGADCLSFWSGAPDDNAPAEELWRRLLDGLEQLAPKAQALGVPLAFEPEPGMFIDAMARFDELQQRFGAGRLALTIDLGHLHCLGETPIPAYIARYAPLIRNIHIEDMRRGVHEHLMFGEGEMEFAPIVDALAKSGYQGGVYVELSRHSHMGPQAARKAIEFLKPLANWET